MKTNLLTFGILAAGIISSAIAAPRHELHPAIGSDTLQQKVLQVDQDSQGRLWKMIITGFQGGDTLTLSEWIPEAGKPFLFGCCHEVNGWYEAISGTNVTIPEGYKKTDSINLSFSARKVAAADRPVVVISGQKKEGSFRFSRSTEVRLGGDTVYYKFDYNVHIQGLSNEWQPYTRPLLLNRSGVLKVINTSSHKAPSPVTKLKLIKISDFERIEATPSPIAASTPDQILRLVDGDTTEFVVWNTCSSFILLNPGVARTPASLTIWFSPHSDSNSGWPGRITFEGSDDGHAWTTIASKKTKRRKMRTRAVVALDLPADPVSYRYFRITTEGLSEKMSIAETALLFSQ